MSNSPKVFISYSWSSPEHQAWVIDLATQLRDNGVDAILDKWDLKEGHDSIAFMEKMITDPTVEKVVIVSDRVYAEKADGRQGGVGTETQIISPQVYAKADQNKFVAVTSETNAEGKPFLPAYYGARIYIDLSNQEIYPENFEQLVRWIFNKPSFPKPQIGKSPIYLQEDTVLLPTKSRAQRVTDLIQKGSSLSDTALRDYLESLAGGFEALRLDEKSDPIDEAVVASIDSFLPYRDEFVRVLTTCARHSPSDEAVNILRRFYENVIPFRFPIETMAHWQNTWFDNYRFIIHELFLYNVAIFIKHERFRETDELLTGGLYTGAVLRHVQASMSSFALISEPVSSFQTRNQRLALRRLRLRADIIRDRAKIAGVSFDDIMQADFVLFLRDASDALKAGKHNSWQPDTLVWAQRKFQPFEIFARSRSRRYFDKIKGMLGVDNDDDLRKLAGSFGKTLYRPQWEFDFLNTEELMGLDQIGTAA